MMYAYSVSTNRSLVVALAVVMSGPRAQAQPGWVLSHQKISDTEGGFTGTLADGDLFGYSVVLLGDRQRMLVGASARPASRSRGRGSFKHNQSSLAA